MVTIVPKTFGYLTSFGTNRVTIGRDERCAGSDIKLRYGSEGPRTDALL